jgi:Cdc6-like AAA superfamily ATPase
MLKKIYIKTLPQPKLKRVDMKCDKLIDKKLLEYPMISDCFAFNHFSLVVGGMGSGKTSLIRSFMEHPKIWKKTYENVIIVMPFSSRNSLAKDIFDVLPAEQQFGELTPSVLTTIIDMCKDNAKEDENTIVIIDDFQSIFKDKEVEKKMNELILMMRHIHTTIVLLCQNYKKTPLSLRDLVFNLIVFNNLSKNALIQIFEEQFQDKAERFQSLLKVAFHDKHDWICINTKSKKIYKEFDEIVIPDENDGIEK